LEALVSSTFLDALSGIAGQLEEFTFTVDRYFPLIFWGESNLKNRFHFFLRDYFERLKISPDNQLKKFHLRIRNYGYVCCDWFIILALCQLKP